METTMFLSGITLEQLASALKPLLDNSTISVTKTSNELLSREEACELLKINKTSLWKHTKNGKLKSYGIGNRVLYKRDELLDSIKPLNF
jgi:excisionase family DNA binding protein